jgi:hypothetical protein
MMVAAEEGGAGGAAGGGKGGGADSGDNAQIEIPFCGCLSVRYYQPVQYATTLFMAYHCLFVCVLCVSAVFRCGLKRCSRQAPRCNFLLPGMRLV